MALSDCTVLDKLTVDSLDEIGGQMCILSYVCFLLDGGKFSKERMFLRVQSVPCLAHLIVVIHHPYHPHIMPVSKR